MDDDLIAAVCQAVDALVDEGRLDTGNPHHLDRLVRQVREEVVGANGVDQVELRVTVCMGWLGPGSAGPPPRAMVDELTGLVRRHEPDESRRPDRVMEFAVAYGIGRWRAVAMGHGTWAQRWPGALGALARSMTPAVREANRWLAATVAGFPELPNPEAHAAATRLALMVEPGRRPLPGDGPVRLACTPDGLEIDVVGMWAWEVPAGGKLVLDADEVASLGAGAEIQTWPAGTRVVALARDDDAWLQADGGRRLTLREWDDAQAGPASALVERECSCGHRECTRRHRLDAWPPDGPGVSLWSYAASAVKGPHPDLRTGVVMQGMYFGLLAREGCGAGRVRAAPVESKACRCGVRYEGRACPECHEPFDPGSMPKVADDRLILVGVEPPLYRREARLKCENCGNLYHLPPALDALRDARRVLADPDLLAGLAAAKGLDAKAFHRGLVDRRAALEEEIRATRCPVAGCGGGPGQRPAHAWVRTFEHRADGVDLDLVAAGDEGGESDG